MTWRDLGQRLGRLFSSGRDDDSRRAPDDHADERRRRALRKSSASRTCPRCGRSGALSEIEIPDDGTVRKCRWCGFEMEPKP